MRRLFWLLPAAGLFAAAAAFWPTSVTIGQQLIAGGPGGAKAGPQAAELPIREVVLFSSGVGYFERGGQVRGDASVDLTFRENDINDLIKSMVLRDAGGVVEAVSYDSREPVARTLGSFAIDLNDNPGLAGILNQARGEPVEVELPLDAASQRRVVTGTVVGVEKKQLPPKTGDGPAAEADVLNLLAADGLRQVRVSEIERIGFADPALQREFRKALEVLALNHDQQKKSVRVSFAGEGERQVSVGYVVEHPVWKTSYRLVLDAKGEGKPFLQGWAVVENPTDEDWEDVNLALVSGRPISYRMDLYNPLYVPRPLVELERFASLRPPTYEGDVAKDAMLEERAEAGDSAGRRLRGRAGSAAAYDMPAPAAPAGGGGGGYAGEALGVVMSPSEADRRKAAEFARKMAEQRNLAEGVQSVASASDLGDSFRYVIQRPVDLPRQKSALLPIVNQEVEAERLSIYNESVLAKHPLRGLRFKNAEGLNLMQGPVTVLEGSTYAGDAQLPDLQPKEERLISYAVDLGVEVAPERPNPSSVVVEVSAVRGIVYTSTRFREETVYKAANRTGEGRVVLIEHPNRADGGYQIVSEPKPVEETRQARRFRLEVPAGGSEKLTVAEERKVREGVYLTNLSDDQIRYYISLPAASPKLKQALQTALELKAEWDKVRQQIARVEGRVNEIGQDQARLRQNLREMPKEAAAYRRYLDKFDQQEKEIDQLQAKLADLRQEEAAKQRAYEEFLANLKVGEIPEGVDAAMP